MDDEVLAARATVRAALERWGDEKIAVAFNGGKDCMAVMALLRLELGPERTGRLRIVCFEEEDEFEELKEFVDRWGKKAKQKRRNGIRESQRKRCLMTEENGSFVRCGFLLTLLLFFFFFFFCRMVVEWGLKSFHREGGGIKAGLARIVEREGIAAFFTGRRKSDAGGGNEGIFQEATPVTSPLSSSLFCFLCFFFFFLSRAGLPSLVFSLSSPGLFAVCGPFCWPILCPSASCIAAATPRSAPRKTRGPTRSSSARTAPIDPRTSWRTRRASELPATRLRIEK